MTVVDCVSCCCATLAGACAVFMNHVKLKAHLGVSFRGNKPLQVRSSCCKQTVVLIKLHDPSVALCFLSLSGMS
jgi:hypothetical protein